MTLDATTTLADLVDLHPELARELEHLQLDYCCGGRRTLAEACAQRGLDAVAVLAQLDAAAGDTAPAPWTGLGPAELVDHIETTHHRYLHRELPRLDALVEKVAQVHGERHPEVTSVAATFAALRADLEPHLMKEERILFPMIRRLAEADGPVQEHCGSIANPITVMLREHDRAGALLGELRSLTHGFSTPEGACTSFQALYSGLAELEADTHLHVHKENNVLFPLVLELEHRFASTGR